ncbi:alpha/beta fold hydrolase [Hymenobacter arizonensis]|uniref:Pimeloyl-ACP methyl ester carboxylesterase n=1 Tax=Hymenobacter arizonensis TaxID=1227077 RepID=A0A1I6AVE5_HYMAR|nr:alpha/beta hydrolase [Hymenobacter arizonensis]SFQ72646.1 Pimeloyl-ACP methyl ester carboxylesterase [Hymenobacter arizonensis]
MAYIKAGEDTAGNPVNIFYEDWGQGNPVVLIHGWPLDHTMWEHQAIGLAKGGSRVIAYDRRGFGRSSRPWTGYDYDTLAADLNALLEDLDLNNVTLIGFSMGGGEIARYLGTYGDARIARVAFIGAVTPFMLKTDNNPDGVPQKVFDDMGDAIKKDRFDFLQSFAKSFYGVGMISHPVSQGVLDWNFTVASLAAPNATRDCAVAFSSTDFRADLEAVKVPTLVIHGDEDATVPIDASGARTAKMIPHAEYKVYKGAPHGLFFTDKDQLTTDLLSFVGR